MSIGTRQNDPARGGKPVLVLGATGRQGGAVAASLGAAGWAVRALVRNPESEAARALAERGVQLFRGDLSDAAAIRAAMSGAYGVFSVQPNSGSTGSGVTDADEVRFGTSVADLAVEAGVRHLVYSSAAIISKGPTGLGNLDGKLEIEAHVRSLGIASTIVRPATFMDLFVLPGMGLDQGLFSFFMHPDQPIQVISAEDIGRIVAGIFGDLPRFAGQTLEIAGDEVTGRDLQTILTAAAGRPIVYQRFSEALLAGNPHLARNAKVFADGHARGSADIPALKRDFGDLLTLREWLAGAGGAPLHAALAAEGQPVALR